MADSSEAQVRGLTQALLTVPSEEREEARAAPRKKRRGARGEGGEGRGAELER